MHSDPVSRRAFLAGTAGLGAGVALATATAGLTAGTAGALLPTQKAKLAAGRLSTDLYASPDPQRFVFAVFRGSRPASLGPGQVVIVPPGAADGTVFDTELFKDGLPKGKGIYVTEAIFPVAGIYTAVALVQGSKVPFAVQVNESAVAPVVGTAAPTAASPTPTDTLGVDPICTRKPRCSLHDVSLSQVIGNGRPAAVMFATPALCRSQYCGPVLDQMLGVMAPYAQQGVQFAHVEIYASNRGATLSPTVEAWGLPSEPWLFTVDGAGIIKERLDGAMATNEVTAALDRLVA